MALITADSLEEAELSIYHYHPPAPYVVNRITLHEHRNILNTAHAQIKIRENARLKIADNVVLLPAWFQIK